MTAGSGEHGPDHVEMVWLYAVQALPPDEVVVAEANISACADCRRELQALRPVVSAFVFWPTAVLRPSTSLWERLARRIAAETGGRPLVPGPAPQPSAPPSWTEVAPGISCKLLAIDMERSRVSMLVRLAPGADYPPHRHVGVEDLYLLDGELMVDGHTFYPGDHRRGGAGSIDRRVWSETGCTCVLITSLHDALL